MTAEQSRRLLEANVKRQRHAFGEAQRLRSANLITQRAFRTIVEASFLASYSAFESFVEDLFFRALLGTSGIVGVSPRVTFLSRDDAERLIVGDRDFIKWLPLKSGVEALSARVLRDGVPFERLARADSERSKLEEARKLRNGVAHESGKARKDLESIVAKMPPGHRTVAGYLNSTVQRAKRFEVHMDNFEAVGRCLTATDARMAHSYLLPERPYEVGDIAPRGRYECLRMGHTFVVRPTREKLAECAVCSTPKTKWRRQW